MLTRFGCDVLFFVVQVTAIHDAFLVFFVSFLFRSDDDFNLIESENLGI